MNAWIGRLLGTISNTIKKAVVDLLWMEVLLHRMHGFHCPLVSLYQGMLHSLHFCCFSIAKLGDLETGTFCAVGSSWILYASDLVTGLQGCFLHEVRLEWMPGGVREVYSKLLSLTLHEF
jgi:hypothetical protein